VSSQATSWSAALDEMERRLDGAEQLIANPESDAVPAFEPPAVDGPVPAELAARADALVARGLALQQQLLESMTQVRADLARIPRRPAARSGAARFEIDA
jgi:hypothetical protein